jgi:hypothetical protein
MVIPTQANQRADVDNAFRPEDKENHALDRKPWGQLDVR